MFFGKIGLTRALVASCLSGATVGLDFVALVEDVTSVLVSFFAASGISLNMSTRIHGAIGGSEVQPVELVIVQPLAGPAQANRARFPGQKAFARRCPVSRQIYRRQS